MWDVDHNQKETGLLETESNDYSANSQFFWTKMANIFIYYKSSGGNVSVLGVQILSLYDQILQPSPSHIYSQPLWLYVRSVTSVSHAGAMITGNF